MFATPLLQLSNGFVKARYFICYSIATINYIN